MQSISFDTGSKEYEINGKSTVKINIADLNMKARVDEMSPVLDRIVKEMSEIDTPTAQQLQSFDAQVKEIIDYAFGAPVSQAAFGNLNCLSPNSRGELIFEAFINAFMPLLQKDMAKLSESQSRKIEQKTAQYTAHLNKSVVPAANLEKLKLNAEQLAYLESLASGAEE